MTKIDDCYAWQERTELLLGEDKMQRLRKAHVLVVGLGGVGAYAAEMICRAGVGEMTIIDADTVQPSNINRQLPATHATIGRAQGRSAGRAFPGYQSGGKATCKGRVPEG